MKSGAVWFTSAFVLRNTIRLTFLAFGRYSPAANDLLRGWKSDSKALKLGLKAGKRRSGLPAAPRSVMHRLLHVPLNLRNRSFLHASLILNGSQEDEAGSTPYTPTINATPRSKLNI